MQTKMNQLLRYRNAWLGCAVVWIVLSHSGFEFPSYLFTYLKMWGYGGVDICLFASGIGCYFSLEKDADILRFQKRRIVRLAPAYLCVIVVWNIHKMCGSGMPMRAAIGNLLGVQGLTGLGDAFNWYIAALIILYILAPYLKALADRLTHTWAHYVVVGVFVILTIPFWTADNFIIIVTRLPIFYFGMYFARQCNAGKQLNLRDILSYTVAVLVGITILWKTSHIFSEILWSHGWHWYPFILIVPGLCVWISLAGIVLEKFKIGRWGMGMLESIGKYSFEIYLIHIPLYEILIEVLPARNLPVHGNLLWVGTIPIIAVACILLRTVANRICGLLYRKNAVS